MEIIAIDTPSHTQRRPTMKKLVTLFALPLLIAACSSSDYDEPPQPRGRGGYGGYGGGGEGAYNTPRGGEAAGGGAGLNIVPLTDWWHQPAIADPMKLTNDQFTALDKIASEHSDDIQRLDRDNGVALRDFRQVLDSNQPSTADVTEAAGRVRALRNTLFDRQVDMLAAERAVLTQTQWQTLEQQLRAARSQRGEGQGRPGGRGGRGMGGGRGRWPGF